MRRRDFITLLGGAAAAWPLAANAQQSGLPVVGFLSGVAQRLAGFTTAPMTSAGVFNSAGVLVRTLWSAELEHPNVSNPEAAWDGTLEDGTVAPSGSYTIKVLSHNVQYTWDGSIGCSSPDHST